MTLFSWSLEKNLWLIENRGISFERVINLIAEGAILDIVRHPNPVKYPTQRMFIVEVDNYAHLVPFVETRDEIFLKTIIPSSKATRKYLGESLCPANS